MRENPVGTVSNPDIASSISPKVSSTATPVAFKRRLKVADPPM